jgi:CRISPR/Cas system Type II protein with McrA/HNH and RuvC-like nuclease domain
MNDDELELTLKNKSFEERKLTLEVIELLEEVDRRQIFLARGYGSLIEYCVNELKYSESSAYRRISAMRVVREVPETKTALEAGKLNLATIAQAHTFFKAEAKLQRPYSKENKSDLLAQLENKSFRETEKILLQISPEAVPQERAQRLTAEKTRLTLVVSENLLEKLDRLKNLVSHAKPNCNYGDLIDMLADLALKKLDHVHTGPNQRRDATPTQALARKRYIPASVKRAVWQKSRGRCCYRDAKTGKVCGSRRFLEIDHIQPYSHGGTNIPENLQLLCDAHNRWRYRQPTAQNVSK